MTSTPDRIKEAIGVIANGLLDQQKEPNSDQLDGLLSMLSDVANLQWLIEDGVNIESESHLEWLVEDEPEASEEVKV